MAKCPKCNASLEEEINLCGNCKAQLVWKNGEPRLSAGYAIQQAGCALTSLGCLIPILIILLLMIYVVFV